MKKGSEGLEQFLYTDSLFFFEIDRFHNLIFFPHFPYQCRLALVFLEGCRMRVSMISVGNMRSIEIYFMVLSYRFLFNFIPHLFCFLFAASHSPYTHTPTLFVYWDVYPSDPGSLNEIFITICQTMDANGGFTSNSRRAVFLYIIKWAPSWLLLIHLVYDKDDEKGFMYVHRIRDDFSVTTSMVITITDVNIINRNFIPSPHLSSFFPIFPGHDLRASLSIMRQVSWLTKSAVSEGRVYVDWTLFRMLNQNEWIEGVAAANRKVKITIKSDSVWLSHHGTLRHQVLAGWANKRPT